MKPRVILAVAWIAFYGAYWIWVALGTGGWRSGLLGGLLIVSALGIAQRWGWTQWIVYAFAVMVVVAWVYGLYSAIKTGGFPLDTPLQSALSLLPGIVILTVTIWSADTVRRRFRRPLAQA